MYCHVMYCHIMYYHVMSCHAMSCTVMLCNVIVIWCGMFVTLVVFIGVVFFRCGLKVT
jgi:hypothetical protein